MRKRKPRRYYRCTCSHGSEDHTGAVVRGVGFRFHACEICECPRLTEKTGVGGRMYPFRPEAVR